MIPTLPLSPTKTPHSPGHCPRDTHWFCLSSLYGSPAASWPFSERIEGPLLPGPTTQVQWTTAGMYDRRPWAKHQKMKTRAVLSWCISPVLRIAQELLLGSRTQLKFSKKTEIKCKGGSRSARTVFSSKAMCQLFVAQLRERRYLSDGLCLKVLAWWDVPLLRFGGSLMNGCGMISLSSSAFRNPHHC